ncbi:hypothetical protein GCM10010924_42720 [Rhizobium wenxiniae]|nr:hypothetical protein GCM10010924_42720 [Rhizobium wenxiniae]
MLGQNVAAVNIIYIISVLFRGAVTPRAYDAIGAQLERIRKVMPCDAHLVPRAEQHGEIGTDFYHGGLAIPGYAGLHPARYVAGLAQAAERAGVTIIGGIRVTAIERQAAGFRVSAGRKQIQAKQVLLATNGYNGSLYPFLQRRIIPIRSAIIATEPLPSAVMSRLMPKRRMLAGSQRVVTYFRPSPDGTRIVFGGRVLKVTGEDVVETNAAHLRKQMLQVFPELADAGISHYWHGQTGFTFDKLPHLGQHEGVDYACGSTGPVSRVPAGSATRLPSACWGSKINRVPTKICPSAAVISITASPGFCPSPFSITRCVTAGTSGNAGPSASIG